MCCVLRAFLGWLFVPLLVAFEVVVHVVASPDCE